MLPEGPQRASHIAMIGAWQQQVLEEEETLSRWSRTGKVIQIGRPKRSVTNHERGCRNKTGENNQSGKTNNQGKNCLKDEKSEYPLQPQIGI